jgi:hypothetical protein
VLRRLSPCRRSGRMKPGNLKAAFRGQECCGDGKLRLSEIVPVIVKSGVRSALNGRAHLQAAIVGLKKNLFVSEQSLGGDSAPAALGHHLVGFDNRARLFGVLD